MSAGHPSNQRFHDVVREAWRLAGGDGAVPTTANAFRERLTCQVESVLADGYYDEMTAMGNRLREAAEFVAFVAVDESEILSRANLRELSWVNRSAATNAMRLSMSITLDLVEGRVRRVGDPPFPD